MPPSTETFHIVLNPGSGRHDSDEIKTAINAELGGDGRTVVIHQASSGDSIETLAREVVAAARAEDGVVVAAGGDGTIIAVARATLGSGCR